MRMRNRNMLTMAILIVGAIASFYCYTRLAQLLPMSDASKVMTTNATITSVYTPMVKKGQTVSDVANEVTFAFEANGQHVEGCYTLKGRDKAPEQGAKEPVAYLVSHPTIFLRADDYADLPRQLLALRVMMVVFALAALVLPFVVWGMGKR